MDYGTEAKLRILRGATREAAEIVRRYRTGMQAHNSRWDIDDTAKRKGRLLLRKEVEDQLAALKAQTGKLAAEVRADLERTANRPPKVDGAVTVQADNLRARLARADNLNAEALILAREAASRGDDPRLRALRIVLPDLLGQRDLEMDPELSAFLIMAGSDGDAREALVALGELERGAYRTTVSLNLVSHDLAAGSYDDPTYRSVLPDWTTNQDIEIGPQTTS